VTYVERATRAGPKRLLALDGGGIRGLITVEILAHLEAQLRRATGNDALVLADYFDYVAGTSTGAIIATSIAKGFPIERTRDLYVQAAHSLFKRAPWWHRFNYGYVSLALEAKLKAELGDETFGDPALRTLLLLVLRNADTGSTWPLSNNPFAKYNDPALPGSNLNLPLWQVIRASTAAPTYFPPQEIVIDGRARKFVDGSVSVYANPAFILFLMATLPEYRLEWTTGEDAMMLVSVGTGSLATAAENVKASQMTLLYNARHVPSALLGAANVEQDVLCRIAGRCRYGGPINSELGSLVDVHADHATYWPKRFTYVRYNPELTQPGLEELGLSDIRAETVQPLLSSTNIEDLRRIGTAYAASAIDPAHFGSHWPS